MKIKTERELAALLYGMKLGASCGLTIEAQCGEQLYFADIEGRYNAHFQKVVGEVELSAESDASTPPALYYPHPVTFAAEGMGAESLREAREVWGDD
jgi:hypothetical protein